MWLVCGLNLHFQQPLIKHSPPECEITGLLISHENSLYMKGILFIVTGRSPFHFRGSSPEPLQHCDPLRNVTLTLEFFSRGCFYCWCCGIWPIKTHLSGHISSAKSVNVEHGYDSLCKRFFPLFYLRCMI